MVQVGNVTGIKHMTNLLSFYAKNSRKIEILSDEWSSFLLGLVSSFDLESINELVSETGWALEEVVQRWNRIVIAGLGYNTDGRIGIFPSTTSLLSRVQLISPQGFVDKRDYARDQSPHTARWRTIKIGEAGQRPSKKSGGDDLPRETGTVKWFNNAKGYGFIQRSSGEDVFVHLSQSQINATPLNEGDKVEFEVQRGPKGMEAKRVFVFPKGN